MATRKIKPTSPGRRFGTYQIREELTTDQPEKSLTGGAPKSGGRNSDGRITSRHRGGGAKRRYRKIDFKRRKDGVPGKVASIEYDPNRTTYIALVHYADGEKRYILAPQGLRIGAEVNSGEGADIRPGNALRAFGDPDRHRRPRGRARPRARAPASGAPRAPRSRWSRRRARWSASGFPPGRRGWSAPSAGRPWARSPTPSTRT